VLSQSGTAYKLPPSLARAHAALDRLYRPGPFNADAARVAHLFERYQALTTSS
jgi:hypothetical protein